MTQHSWFCPQCGAPLDSKTSVTHYCPNTPRTVGAQVSLPITENDVRRISREELDAYFAKRWAAVLKALGDT